MPAGTVALAQGRAGGESGGVTFCRSRHVCSVPRSSFAGYRFPPEVIVLAVRWYLRFGLSYRSHVIDLDPTLVEQILDVGVGEPEPGYQRTARTITSGGNRKPLNAELEPAGTGRT
jgi:hypothetical protein